MQAAASPMAEEIFALHMLIYWICVAIAVLVFGFMFFSIFRYRKSKGAVAAQFHESTTVEIAWTIVPFLILVGMAVPATRTLIAMEDTSGSELSVVVTGYQWYWKYDYLGEDVSFFSRLTTSEEERLGQVERSPNYLLEVDNPVVIPTNTKVRFLLTSNDVIHAWWVPRFGVKKDAIPGFVNEVWADVSEPGVYRGLCAELCGRGHAFMPIEVHVVPQEEYVAWLDEQRQLAAAEAEAAEQEWSQEDLMTRGQQVYNTNCAMCHQANGQGVPGVFPALAGSDKVTGDVEQAVDIVMNGVPGTAMPAFGPQLNDVDLAAVVTYIRNAWDNNAGDAVQPADIQAAR
ncbi:cytochrome c oxidase subunit II [Ectothiorhodospiraceae bacterium 2226]|nr:cytochrome c oxidase subunit II [Ectothiorhodospiraceae bacterium 2226]